MFPDSSNIYIYDSSNTNLTCKTFRNIELSGVKLKVKIRENAFELARRSRYWVQIVEILVYFIICFRKSFHMLTDTSRHARNMSKYFGPNDL